MTIGRKICGLIIVAVTAALLLCAAFLLAPAAKAENPAPVTLSDDTVFAVSPTHVAYTSGNSLSIVDLSYSSDPFTLSNAFEGSATDIEITSDKIAVLSVSGENKILTVFDYNSETGSIDSSSTIIPEGMASLEDAVMLETTNDSLLLVTSYGVRFVFGDDTDFHYRPGNLSSPSDTVLYDDAVGMVFSSSFGSGTMYFVKGSTLYTYDSGNAQVPINPDGLPLPGTAHGMAKYGDLIYIALDDGVYLFFGENNVSKLSGMSYASAIDIEGDYLYAFDKAALAIKRYTITDDALVYNKCYDAEEYLAPTDFDIVRVLQPAEGESLTVYRSPRDLEVVAQAGGGIVALTLVSYDGGDGETSYYYCVTQDGEYGYVPAEQATLTDLADPGYTAAQPLHGITRTPVYNFPYKASGELCTLSTDESGSVIMTRGEESLHVLLTATGLLQAEGNTWCKVLISAGDESLTGYMDARLVCPYVSYSPAGVQNYCKIDSGRAGVYIKLFTQPDENSEVVAELPDNTELMLASPYDENSEWTCVFYGDTTAYVRTESVTTSALTTVQITLIVVLCVLAALGVALGVTIYIRRKKKREYNEES